MSALITALLQLTGCARLSLIQFSLSGEPTPSVSPTPQPSSSPSIPQMTPPPIGASEPVYVPGNQSMLYQDNMDSYIDTPTITANYRANWATYKGVATSAAMSGYPEDPSTSVIQNGRSGKAIRVSYSGVYQDGHSLYITGFQRSNETKPLYIQYYFRFIWSAPPTGALAVKWIELWHPPDSNGLSRRIQFNTRYSNYAPVSGSATSVWEVIDSVETAHQGEQPYGDPYSINVLGQDGGKWHRVTYAYLPNSVSGAKDGFARMWIDGKKIIDISQTTVALAPSDGIGHPWCDQSDVDFLQYGSNGQIESISFAGPQTTTTPAWTLDWDDFQMWQ